MKHLILIISILLLPFTAIAQDDFCIGNFDYDNDVDGSDAALFKTNFGRSRFDFPCPPDGPAPVPKTGQTTSYATGDDGEWERGMEKPPLKDRFTDNGDGSIQDNLTGLIWLKNANCFGMRTWNNALSDANGLQAGYCGLTDGSQTGEWRLPNYKELISLVSVEYNNPAMPFGHPFTYVQPFPYWTSTTYVSLTFLASFVNMENGVVSYEVKSHDYYVWPVRGGN